MSIQIYKSWQVAQYQNIQWVGDPFRFQEWLTLLPIRPYTDHDWEPSPHYPKLMKNGILQSSKMMPVGIMNHLTPHRTEWWVHFIPIWWFCNYCKQPIINSFQFQDQDMESFIISPTMMLEIHEWEIQSKECDYESLYTLFAWLCTDKTKCAFEAATQYARIPLCTILWKHYKLPFRGLLMYIIDKRLLPHIPCLQTPGCQQSIHICTNLCWCAVPCDWCLWHENWQTQFVNTLEDVIWQIDAPTKLISDPCTGRNLQQSGWRPKC